MDNVSKIQTNPSIQIDRYKAKYSCIQNKTRHCLLHRHKFEINHLFKNNDPVMYRIIRSPEGDMEEKKHFISSEILRDNDFFFFVRGRSFFNARFVLPGQASKCRLSFAAD